jgi:hypothetical protein
MSDNVERALGNVEGQLKLVVSSINDLVGRIDRRDETVDERFAATHARISKNEKETDARFSKIERKAYIASGIGVAVLWGVTHLGELMSFAISTANAAGLH